MYPALPFGPVTLPTGPFFVLFAVYFGLDTAARVGLRFRLRSDDVWNTGLLALLAGLVVARLWNVVQFWYVYAAEPLLIFSLRPSGYALLPGLVAALIAAYAWMLHRALSPMRLAAAFAVGALVASAFLSVGDYLTGGLTGLETDVPWALPYYGEMQHPVGLYRLAGLIVVLLLVLWQLDPARPARTLYQAGLGWGLVYLIADGFAANADLIGPFRATQMVGFGVAAVCAALLAFDKSKPEPVTTAAEAALQPPSESPVEPEPSNDPVPASTSGAGIS